MNNNVLIVAAAAFAGGILSAVMGWLDSKEPFDARKFGKSIIASLLAGLVFAVKEYVSSGDLTIDVLVALISGAGVDALANRGIGAAKALSGPKE